MLADVAKSQGSLPRLRQDLRLLPGQVQSDGSPSWRIHDPVRNRFFEIGWLEFELLARWAEVSTLDQLAQRVSSETTLQPSADELRELVEFLQRNQLFIVEDSALRRGLHLRWMAGLRPWHQRLLHHYLFFRIPLVRPDRFLAATLPWARALVSRWALAALAIIAPNIVWQWRHGWPFLEIGAAGVIGKQRHRQHLLQTQQARAHAVINVVTVIGNFVCQIAQLRL